MSNEIRLISNYMAVLFISIDWMPFPTPTLDNADPAFRLGDKHHVDMADQDLASGSL